MTVDLSHLNAIDLRLSHERSRVSLATTRSEREWRQHNVRMIEREREGEIAFLAKHGIIVEDEPEITMEEIMEEIAEILGL